MLQIYSGGSGRYKFIENEARNAPVFVLRDDNRLMIQTIPLAQQRVHVQNVT
jgi:hypothetical protein